MITFAESAGLNLAELTADAWAKMEDRKQSCLERWKSARQLASAIYSTRSKQGWRTEAERSLAAAQELERMARQMLNRMMQEVKK